MKKIIIPLTMFFTIFTVLFNHNANAGSLSFNGQDAKNPKARNTTFDEHCDLFFRAIAIDNLVFYKLPKDADFGAIYKEHLPMISKNGIEITIKQLNTLNAKGEYWQDGNGKRANIKDAKDAEELLRTEGMVVIEYIPAGTVVNVYSIDNSWNGSYVMIQRTTREGEQGAYLVNPSTGEKTLIWICTCDNPVEVTPSEGSGDWGDPEKSVTVKKTKTEGGDVNVDVKIDFHPTLTQTQTVAPTKAAPDNGDIEELQPDHHEPDQARSTSRSGGNSGRSDDVAYDPRDRGGASAYSNSDSHNKSFLNGNTLVLNLGGGVTRQQPVYNNGGGGGFPRWRTPCHNCYPKPTPPINNGGGPDMGGGIPGVQVPLGPAGSPDMGYGIH